MKQIVTKIRSQGPKKVLIVGDIILDEYFFGSVKRISPEAPVPVLKEEYREWCLGGAANVALNCKQIDMNPILFGVVGNDFEGQKVIELLQNHNMDVSGIVVSTQRPTTCKRRMVAKNHQMLRVDYEVSTALSSQDADLLQYKINKHIEENSVVLISDYAKGVVTTDLLEKLFAKKALNNTTFLVDPKGQDYMKYVGADYIKPNAHEYTTLLEHFDLDPAASIEENSKEICSLLGIKGLIVTKGEEGMYFASQDLQFHIPSVKRDVIDLTGAGDTVFAFMALGFVYGIDITQTLKIANHAASIAVSHFKTYAVSLDELLNTSFEIYEKIYTDWADLKIELDWARAGGKKVVFTNGCFDILHPGHIHTLVEAKKQGDILVVALNADASIARLKGAGRPINDNEFRAKMMAAIGVVDFVVFFEQDTPQALIEYIRPDILVKGGDYKKENIVGYDFVRSYGGDVVVINFIDGHSTTKIIQTVSKHVVV